MPNLKKERTMSGRRILIYSTDEINQNAFIEQFSSCPNISNSEVINNIDDLLLKARQDLFDAAVIDEDRDVCELLRTNKFIRPIILVGSFPKEEIEDNTNIDDFIEKPIKINNFLSRLYRSICRYESADEKGFIIANYIFKPLTKSIENKTTGEEIRLTEKETEILSYLYRAKGEIIDKDELLKEIWAYNTDISTHTLETHIYRLRQKIDTNEKKPIIISEDGGYRLCESSNK